MPMRVKYRPLAARAAGHEPESRMRPSSWNTLWQFACTVAVAVSMTGCQSLLPPRQATLDILDIGDTSLGYLEQGTGVTVVMVHGAFSDHRVWEMQRSALARRYHYVAIDQRYFGPQPWSDNGERYTVPAHAADLAAFVRRLGVGPVHLVGWSYGGSVVLALALLHPELVRSVVVHEPAVASVVSDPAGRAVMAEERKGFSAVVSASRAGDAAQATRLFAEWVNAQPGGFDALPPAMRAVHLDNQRTTALQIKSPPPTFSCEQLAAINVPTLVTKGAQTRPMFHLIADAVARCVPIARTIEIPDARHLAPYENPDGFNRAVLDFLAAQ